ncbi:MAG: hypothetical protein IH623_26700 [Verrucomicrobia bacterium]|nr:hypothetical protein [Verrucomicrobiota bacterium]
MKELNIVRTLILTASLLLGTLVSPAPAAPGDVDLSFDTGSGVNGQVSAIVVQPDGKIIIGGTFSMVKGLLRTNLARLNADGSGDATFNAGPAIGIMAMTLQADGKLLVAGPASQTFCDDETGCYTDFYATVIRLNANGSQDGTFTPAIAEYSSVTREFRSLAVLSDGKILVGGEFLSVNGTPRPGVARLNANGTLDTNFNATGINGAVQQVIAQPDGKVLVAGNFQLLDGTNHFGVVRLNANGSFDPTFDAGFVAYQSLDCGPMFSCWEYTDITALTLEPNGKLLVGVWKRLYQSPLNGGENVITGQYSVKRLNADGSNDPSFVFTNALALVRNILVQSDGKLLVRHGFNTSQLQRFNANGSWDGSFNPVNTLGSVNAAALQPDGKVLIGGNSVTLDGPHYRHMARLNPDGSRDTSFDSGQGLAHAVSRIALQPDGKVLLGGTLVVGDPFFGPVSDVLAFVNGTNRHGKARLNVDGSLDSGFIPTPFHPPLEARYHTENCLGDPRYGCLQGFVSTALLVQSDGKVLMSGTFITTVYGDEVFYQVYNSFLGRFTAAGGLEEEFNLPDVYVNTMAQQPDGKIVIGGSLTLNGIHSTVARLNYDGSVDGSFQSGQGPAVVSCLALQSDGKIVVGGGNLIARLNGIGSHDPGFSPVVLSNGVVSSLALQPDGKVFIGGSFTNVSGTTRNRIARLNADGSLDTTFNPGTGADGVVQSIALQPDGNVLIGGNFTTVNGVLRPYVARLYGDIVPPSLNITRSNSFVIISWPSAATGFEVQQNTNLSAGNWTTPTETVTDNGTTKSISVGPSPGNRFFRLFKP